MFTRLLTTIMAVVLTSTIAVHANPLNLVIPADAAFVVTQPASIVYSTNFVPPAAGPLDPALHGIMTINTGGAPAGQVITDNVGTSSMGLGSTVISVVIQHSDNGGPLAQPLAVFATLSVDNIFIVPGGDASLAGTNLFTGDQLKPTGGPGGQFGFNNVGNLEFVFAQDGNNPKFAKNDAPVGVIVALLQHFSASSGTPGTDIDFTAPAFFTTNFNGGDGKIDVFTVPEPTTAILIALGMVASFRRPSRKTRLMVA